MFKKTIILLLCLLIIPLAIAETDELYTYEELTLHLNIDSYIDIEPKTTGYQLNYVKANLEFYPAEDYRQIPTNIDTEPFATKVGGLIEFEWENPIETKLEFELDSNIETKSAYVEVNEKIKFPLLDLPSNVSTYLQETDLIDYSDSSIRNTANSIAAGEDDLYVVVFDIAKWVNNNIEYDLNTVTAEASQPASWVIENKYGVCDEMTNLFIAMLRSIGVPSRFVTGVSYTTSELFTENWGAHGWAEVYFPEYGWIPFDVTYNQLGFIDATHIKLKDTADSDKTSVNYEWSGNNVNLLVHDLEISARVISKGEELTAPYTLDAEIIKTTTSFGSYNLLEVTVQNNANYYIPLTVFVSRSEGLSYLEDYSQEVLLLPNEEGKLFWTVIVDDSLLQQYEYYFDIRAYTLTNESEDVVFQSRKDYRYYSLEEINEIKEQKTEESEKVYSDDVYLDCGIESELFYIEETPGIICSISNVGNTMQENIGICYEDECKELSLSIAQEDIVEFGLKEVIVGTNEIFISAKNDDISKSDEIEFVVIDKPSVKISDINALTEVGLGENMTINFTLLKQSTANPLNAEVNIEIGNNNHMITYVELFQDEPVSINMNSNDFVKQENLIVISIEFSDEYGNSYNEQQTFVVELVNLSFWDKVKLFIKRIIM